MRRAAWLLLYLLVLASDSTAASSNADLARRVRETEAAFAETMAARDHGAFASYVADEAVFFGSKDVLRGKAAVVAGWKRYFEGPDAPFSWEPAQVEVLDSGKLALSTGPVRDAEGRLVGTFTSIWRRETGGAWKIVFDKGCEVCETRRSESAPSEGNR